MPRKKRLSIFRVALEIIILLLFVRLMFDLNYFTGVFYIIAIFGAFYKKIIFRKKNISWMIICGTLLAYLAGLLLPHAIGSYLAGDIISAIIIALVALVIWTRGRKFKKGE